ncbi:MAG: tripartite tricarboxylate transporter substrate binding protein [Betaproteobacteria bacterium]|nr:MAG: tripartite tricarboxylate transporter substrate binding protein [Betaproteobacteria bacterium]
MNKAIAVMILALLSWAASAQPYPSKPVRVIVPYPAGSTPDIVGRTLAAKLQSAMGQPFVVENRTGAGGNIGADAVAKSPPDGHTLLVAVNGPVAVNKFLYKNMPYDSDKDLLPISLLASSPQMLVAVPALGARSFKEFLDYLRRNPGRVSYGSVGGGSASHLTMELLKSDAKVFAVHIPYRGFPPAVTDMLAGNIHAMFAIIPAVLPHVKTGRIHGLAVTGLKRSALAPDVPSVAELGYPQLESLAWIGLLAPAGTAPAIVSRLSDATVRAMRSSDTRESLGRQGFDVVANSPAEFTAWIRSESTKWSGVIRASGATAD